MWKIGLVFDLFFLVLIVLKFEVLEMFDVIFELLLLFEFEVIRLFFFDVSFFNVFLKDFIIIFKYL